MGRDCVFGINADKNDDHLWSHGDSCTDDDDDDDDADGEGVDAADDTNGGDGVQQSQVNQVSSSEPGPSILASNVIGPLLLEV